RKRAAEELSHLNRVHAMVSSINAAIVHVHERDRLLEEACGMAVEHGKFRFAWAGIIDSEARTCTAIAAAGDDRDMSKRLGQPWSIDPSPGRGLVHEAVMMRRAAICNDIEAVQAQLRFGRELVRSGHRAGIVLPLIVDGKATAVFGLYTSEIGFFNE